MTSIDLRRPTRVTRFAVEGPTAAPRVPWSIDGASPAKPARLLYRYRACGFAGQPGPARLVRSGLAGKSGLRRDSRLSHPSRGRRHSHRVPVCAGRTLAAVPADCRPQVRHREVRSARIAVRARIPPGTRPCECLRPSESPPASRLVFCLRILLQEPQKKLWTACMGEHRSASARRSLGLAPPRPGGSPPAGSGWHAGPSLVQARWRPCPGRSTESLAEARVGVGLRKWAPASPPGRRLEHYNDAWHCLQRSKAAGSEAAARAEPAAAAAVPTHG